MAKDTEITFLGSKLKNNDSENHARTILKDYNKQSRIDKIDGKSLTTSIFENSPHIYLNPTENLRMGDFVKEGDRVFTVCGSGDFAIDSLSHDASEIVTFDINNYQYYVAGLKKVALSKLNYEEYYSFFSDTKSNNFLNPEIYNKIKNGEKKSLLFAFWDQIFIQRCREISNLKNNPMYQMLNEIMNGDGQLSMLLSMMMPMNFNFNNMKNTSEYMIGQVFEEMNGENHSKVFRAVSGENGVKTVGSYLENADIYDSCKDKASNGKVSFLKANLLSLKSSIQNYKVSSGFDVIYLSNIPDYLQGEELLNVIDKHLMPLLNEDGKIVYCAQAIDPVEFFSKDKGLVSDIRNNMLSGGSKSRIMADLVRANVIEGYNIISDRYDVDAKAFDTLTTGNQRGSSDIYVKIYK